MAAYEVLTINTNIPQIQAPQSGDTYSFPRVAEFIAGTAAAPALTTTGDTDTGVFFPAANTWAVATGASERMRIDSSGNLTFTGTAQRITGDFSNATIANQLIFQSSTTNGRTRLLLMPNGTGTIAQVLLSSSSDLANASLANFQVDSAAGDVRIVSSAIGTATALPIAFILGGSERMRITSGGNVGIGTQTPAVKLEVAGQIRTEAPTGGTAANWRLGTVHTVSPTSPNRTIEVDIGGTIYYLHAKTTND